MEKKGSAFSIALIGQPNTGKSTLFNQLTGAHQHVGNWPGKTVEKKSGNFTHNNITYEIVDLPGTYSLTANSTEEIITRDYILNNQPNVVIVIVDASQLERTMYLLTEAITLPSPVILVVNMIDVAQQENRSIDIPSLRQNLNLPVIPMIAAKGTTATGLRRL